MKNIPIEIFLPFCIISCCYLIYSAIKRIKIDRKGLIELYIIASAIFLVVAIARIFEYLSINTHLIFIIMGILSILLAIDMFFLIITHKGDERSKRLILIGSLMFTVLFLIIAIIIIFGILL